MADSGYSNFGLTKAANMMFGDVPAIATYYFGLARSVPDIADTGSTVDEVIGIDYARVAVTNDLTNFPVGTNGVVTNGTAITFPTATGSWAPAVRYFFIADDPTAGNLIAWGKLANALTINDGQTARFPAGSLTITQQ